MKGLLKTRPSGFITPNLQLGNQLIRTTPLEIEFIFLLSYVQQKAVRKVTTNLGMKYREIS